jgi:hypothetical protein
LKISIKRKRIELHERKVRRELILKLNDGGMEWLEKLI